MTTERTTATDRTTLLGTLAARIDSVVAENSLPGIVVGLIADGDLVWTYGSGETRLGNATTPDPDTVFRIASMTKSFTAAAIMLLRDRGALRLDDPIVEHLPWTVSIGVPANAAPICVRDLLTMNAGFPTDDPWGDRHEPLPLAHFDALIAGGLSFTREPRTGFEYSNLGYALLGRVISAVAGVAYRDFVERELLAPLGMTSTRFDTSAVDERRRAHGYVLRDAELVAEPTVGPGAFSPMGGLHSSIRDLALWVRGFADPDDRRGIAHPLTRSSRREMQEGRTHRGTTLVAATESVAAKTITSLYGYGLVSDLDSELGRFIHHSGGYPGFGSHMRWHPASGWGIVALANRTYAPMAPLAAALLSDVVRELSTPSDVAGSLWPATRAAMDVVERLTAQWDDALADAHFAFNVDLDLPRNDRRAALGELAREIGPFTRDATTLESASAAHAKWRVRGTNADADFEILLTPERSPRIQTFNVLPAARA